MAENLSTVRRQASLLRRLVAAIERTDREMSWYLGGEPTQDPPPSVEDDAALMAEIRAELHRLETIEIEAIADPDERFFARVMRDVRVEIEAPVGASRQLPGAGGVDDPR